MIELRSATDALEPLQIKMQEYMNSSVRLGWLINPQDQQVEIYCIGQLIDIQPLPIELSGADYLPDFKLDLAGL